MSSQAPTEHCSARQFSTLSWRRSPSQYNSGHIISIATNHYSLSLGLAAPLSLLLHSAVF